MKALKQIGERFQPYWMPIGYSLIVGSFIVNIVVARWVVAQGRDLRRLVEEQQARSIQLLELQQQVSAAVTEIKTDTRRNTVYLECIINLHAKGIIPAEDQSCAMKEANQTTSGLPPTPVTPLPTAAPSVPTPEPAGSNPDDANQPPAPPGIIESLSNLIEAILP